MKINNVSVLSSK